MSFATCKVIICLYFWLSSSKDWKYMAYVAIILAIISFILTYFYMPESPRFLVSKKRYDEALVIL
jgi:drug/metabolite transporter (DMT)-like permease